MRRWAEWLAYWLMLYLSVGLLGVVVLVTGGCSDGVRTPKVNKEVFRSSCDLQCEAAIERALLESYVRNGR